MIDKHSHYQKIYARQDRQHRLMTDLTDYPSKFTFSTYLRSSGQSCTRGEPVFDSFEKWDGKCSVNSSRIPPTKSGPPGYCNLSMKMTTG